jgi:nitrate/TMAO reductase-like tetraheme cytochrome c subunit
LVESVFVLNVSERLYYALKRTWNEYHGTQSEFERKRGELAAREWRVRMARNAINDLRA